MEIASQTEQLTALRGALKGLTEEDQKTIAQKALYDNEEAITERFAAELEQIKESVESLQARVGEEDETPEPPPQTGNSELIRNIQSAYSATLRTIREHISRLVALFDEDSLSDIEQALVPWREKKKAFDAEYETAKSKATSNRQQLDQIQEIEKRIAELRRLQTTSRGTLKEVSEPASGYGALRQKWNDLHANKLQVIEGQCTAFSTLSDGLIRAEARNSLDIAMLKQKLRGAFTGLNVRDQKLDELCLAIIGAADPIAEWGEVLSELEALAFHNVAGTEPMPATTRLDRCGLIPNEKSRIASGLNPAKWLELSVTELEFSPSFEYCRNKDTQEFIAFADASAGQQATALLTVLLNQPGASLIIDQPEDDVDSKMSPEIVRKMWTAKRRRQFIFASHNANLVVNGDAELVICCDYVRAGDQTGGQIKAMGAIDSPNIKEEITSVTEGGREAFKLRHEKYGF